VSASVAIETGALSLPGTPLADAERSRFDGFPLACRWLGRVSFEDALALQEQIVVARRQGRTGDVLLLLEHDPVYTTGRGGRTENLGVLDAGVARTDAGVVRIGRGGDVTYHGPGQLVGYALLDLRARGGDVHRFLRDLEAGVIATLATLGVRALRWQGKTGVWVADAGLDPEQMDDMDMHRGRVRKIASIGIAVRGGVSMHGFAMNVDLELAPFAAIVPCGLSGVHMTTVADETDSPTPSLPEVAAIAAREVAAAFAGSAREVSA